MLISKKKAVLYYEKLPLESQSPSLHPEALELECLRYTNATPIYFLYQESSFFWLHQTIQRNLPSPNETFYDLISPNGYGGPTGNNHSTDFLTRAWHCYQNFIRESGIIAEFVRFHPLLNNHNYWFGKVLKNRSTVWVDLTMDNIEDNFLPRRRLSIKNINKNNNLIFTIEKKNPLTFLKQFTQIYYEKMNQLKADKSYFFNDEYFKKLITSENVMLCSVLNNKNLLASSIFLKSKNIFEYYLSASTDESKKFSANDFLLYQAVVHAKKEGMKKCHLGGGVTTNIDDGLLFYKKGFSNKHSTFYISKEIYNQKKYFQIQEAVQSSKKNSHLLFYRDE